MLARSLERLSDHSHPTPSPSRSRCRPYPGSPRRTGAAPAARAAEQFAKEAPPPIRRCGFSAGAERVGERWQCRPPFLRSLWHPSAAKPPGWLCAAPGIPATTSANEIAIVRIPVSPVARLQRLAEKVESAGQIPNRGNKPRNERSGDKSGQQPKLNGDRAGFPLGFATHSGGVKPPSKLGQRNFGDLGRVVENCVLIVQIADTTGSSA